MDEDFEDVPVQEDEEEEQLEEEEEEPIVTETTRDMSSVFRPQALACSLPITMAGRSSDSSSSKHTRSLTAPMSTFQPKACSNCRSIECYSRRKGRRPHPDCPKCKVCKNGNCKEDPCTADLESSDTYKEFLISVSKFKDRESERRKRKRDSRASATSEN